MSSELGRNGNAHRSTQRNSSFRAITRTPHGLNIDLRYQTLASNYLNSVLALVSVIISSLHNGGKIHVFMTYQMEVRLRLLYNRKEAYRVAGLAYSVARVDAVTNIMLPSLTKDQNSVVRPSFYLHLLLLLDILD